jgi:phosphatidylglycerol:prolipoprotein diacylglycerol transferase
VITITPDPVAVQLGPISVPWYGLGYAAAIALGVWLTQREARRRGLDPRLVADGILFVAALGLIGARLYHVIDQWAVYSDDPLRIILPPYSGLGLYGGVIGGIVALLIYTRRRGQPFPAWGDAAVPALLLGQAIARWGNFFNQELYGPPTDLPWGIAIECQYRVAAAYPCSSYPVESTGFHPLFFYESAANLVGALFAIWLARRFSHRLRDGDLMAFWFIWYGAVRTALEPLRSAYDWTFFGVPVAMIIGIAAVLGGILFLVLRHRRPGPSAAESAAARTASKAAETEHDGSGEPVEPTPAEPAGPAPAEPAGDRPADAPT